MSTRLTAHSSDDNHNLYRTKEDIEAMKEEDCIKLFRVYMLENNIVDEKWMEEIDAELKQVVQEATKKAEAAPYPAPEDALKNVYEEVN